MTAITAERGPVLPPRQTLEEGESIHIGFVGRSVLEPRLSDSRIARAKNSRATSLFLDPSSRLYAPTSKVSARALLVEGIEGDPDYIRVLLDLATDGVHEIALYLKDHGMGPEDMIDSTDSRSIRYMYEIRDRLGFPQMGYGGNELNNGISNFRALARTDPNGESLEIHAYGGAHEGESDQIFGEQLPGSRFGLVIPVVLPDGSWEDLRINTAFVDMDDELPEGIISGAGHKQFCMDHIPGGSKNLEQYTPANGVDAVSVGPTTSRLGDAVAVGRSTNIPVRRIGLNADEFRRDYGEMIKLDGIFQDGLSIDEKKIIHIGDAIVRLIQDDTIRFWDRSNPHSLNRMTFIVTDGASGLIIIRRDPENAFVTVTYAEPINEEIAQRVEVAIEGATHNPDRTNGAGDAARAAMEYIDTTNSPRLRQHLPEARDRLAYLAAFASFDAGVVCRIPGSTLLDVVEADPDGFQRLEEETLGDFVALVWESKIAGDYAVEVAETPIGRIAHFTVGVEGSDLIPGGADSSNEALRE